LLPKTPKPRLIINKMQQKKPTNVQLNIGSKAKINLLTPHGPEGIELTSVN